MWRRWGWLLVAMIVVQLVAAAVAQSFAATPSAKVVIRKMRAEARALRAVRVRRTGALVYCTSVPEGWTYAPMAGCRVPAKVTEEYDLSNGRIERVVGEVTAPHRARLSYVVDSSGWYRSAAGSGCWTLELSGFVAAPWIDYPLQGERVSILSRTPGRIVVQAVSLPDAYKEISYVNPKTFFDYHDVEITQAGHATYRIDDRSVQLQAQTPRPATTPACAQP